MAKKLTYKEIERRVKEFEREVEGHLRTEKQMRQHANELAALQTLGHQLGEILSLKQVVQSALDAMITLVAADLALSFQRENGKLVLLGASSKDPRFCHEKTPVHLVGECLCGIAVKEGKAIYSRDIHTDPRCTWEECKEAGLRSFASLPLKTRSKTIGVLGLGSAVEHDYQAHSSFLEALAAEIAIGLQNTLLYGKLKNYSKDLEKRVQEKTKELKKKNKQLLEAERLAALGKMADRVAHSFRNPLAVIGGFARRMDRKTDDDDPNKECLGIMVREVEKLEKKVSEIIKLKGKEE